MAQLKKLIHQRGQAKGKLTRFKTSLENAQPNEFESLRERYENLPAILKEFEDCQINIANARIEDDSEENANDLEERQRADETETEEFENNYYKLRAIAKVKLNPTTSINQGNIVNTSRVKLPEIKLPHFDGNYQRWTEFKDSFEATIHSKTYLSNVEKFQYLRGLLDDEAARVVGALSTTADNYEEAWRLLKAKYDNHRIIIDSHLKELLNIADIHKTNYDALNSLVVKIRSHTQALKVLGAPIEYWDMILIHIVTNKLDFHSRNEWEKLIGAKPIDEAPTFEELLEYLTLRCQTLQIMAKERPLPEKAKTKFERKVSLATTSQPKCEYCQENHYTNQCEGFKKLSTQAKWDEVHKLRLCANCLRKGHVSKECKGSMCKMCSKRHNTVLHPVKREDQQQQEGKEHETPRTPVVAYSSQEITKEREQQSERATVASCTQQVNSRVILSTALVYVYDVENEPVICRVLLDPGSQLNFVTKRLAQKLRLPLKKINTPFSGVSQSNMAVQNSVTIELESRNDKFAIKQDYLILPQITERLPQIQLNTSLIKIPDNMILADPDFNVPGDIDMLVGAGIFWRLLCEGQVKQAKGQPVLQRTLLGWIVGGEQIVKNPPQAIRRVCNLSVLSDIDEKIERFWKMEELPQKEPYTSEERYCEEHFRTTHTRNKMGRYKVRLPQNPEVQLGDSATEATRRFYALEQRLKGNPKLKRDYTEFLDDYERSGHMTRIKSKQKEEGYYLPHHPIIREESSTTRLRVVFDASAKTTLQTSLNDKLLTGPNLQEEIINIILRFRTYAFVITADIAKMFRQIEVAEEERRLQRIVWRKDSDYYPQIYELNTVTYGTTSAPYLAMRCLKQLAIDDGQMYPQAAIVLKRDFYMDDVLTGSHSIEETIELQKQLTKLLLGGHFKLRKCRANDARILNHLSEQCKEDNILVLDKKEAAKTLGLLWDSSKDTLKYNLQFKEHTKITKRLILSATAAIYDPVGFIGPVIMQAKIILQQLWLLKLSWDELVPQTIATIWSNYYNSLEKLNQLEISRNVNPGNTASTISIHGFGDASEKGYGACIYSLSYNAHGHAHCALVSSKSRVAPLKKVTLPRLELCAAWLLSRLLKVVIEALTEDRIGDIVLWSDSTIVLHWLQTPANQLKTFVANRVAEIQENTKQAEWRHVPTSSNPADVLSRGVTADQLISNELWWHGPEWLPFKDKWPEKKVEHNDDTNEKRSAAILLTINSTASVLTKYSSLSKLERVVAYCLRFIERAKRKGETGPIAVGELNKAEITIIRMTQQEGFPEEIRLLKKNKELNSNSKILMLKPFLDGNELLRVGGRLQKAEIAESQKHPLLLPAKHFITTLIMRETHTRLKHCGPEHLLSVVRCKYWPISGRREARKITRNCVACFKYKPRKCDALMAELPKSRVSGIERPFVTTGVDYAGPLQMRESKRRGRIPMSKVWIAVFTCFKTKAVHLELVTDLTTEAFLAALRRFVARRGICQELHSDNGTNFIGAARELREIYEFLTNKGEEIHNELAQQRIIWKFIPPRAPHFGGLWEAAVKATKRHLYKVTQGLIYTYEEYYTLLVEVESVLNSRPLTPLSSDPHDLSPLTPSHFLLGVSPQEPVTKIYNNVPVNHLSRWQHLQKIKQDFWIRWRKEYLQQLQARTKWAVGTENLKINTLVLLVDDNTPPLHWSLGRVLQVHPGADGVVRVATVRTATGDLKRPIKKLCALPLDN